MPAAIPFIPAALSLAGSIIGAKASKKAARQQIAGLEAAIETQREFLAPFQQAGEQGLAGLQDFVSEGADFSKTQGFKDITNQARAAGQFGSGNRATALAEFLATNFRPERLRELSALPSLGARAAGDLASGIGGIQQNIGDIRGRGTISGAREITSGLGSLDFSSLLRRNNLQQSVDALLDVPGNF